MLLTFGFVFGDRVRVDFLANTFNLRFIVVEDQYQQGSNSAVTRSPLATESDDG